MCGVGGRLWKDVRVGQTEVEVARLASVCDVQCAVVVVGGVSGLVVAGLHGPTFAGKCSRERMERSELLLVHNRCVRAVLRIECVCSRYTLFKA